MPRSNETIARRARLLLRIVAMTLVPATAIAADVDVFHADSLAGPMREIKHAFEARNAGVNLRLTSGVSRDLAARILSGDVCDVFAPSSPAVISRGLSAAAHGSATR